ncbi:phage baseplate assembly protein V [Citrobacter sp. Cpo071]|uniref:phage baseplate assembly protein V n=1 Tax=Citrobacter sp. Cpo071 TaxID=2985133 RepID=UPI002577061B|nr:phage baseplate assembly protein V [Citrobacter sp. Cpo071]MDM2855911.1 phage baseplate assembly protein V [Citrobacter sp. Cpo071]
MSAELLRLLSNVLRVGMVFDISEDGKSVRVQSDDLQTTWLRWTTTRAGAFKFWCPPSLGEQVLLGCIGGNPETAVLLGSLYSKENDAPASSLMQMMITAPDGAEFSYDAEAGALSAGGMKTATIQAATKITLDAPEVECTNHLKAKTFDFTEGGKMTGDVTHSGGALKSNGVQADDHSHGGIESGNSRTKGTA